jgi:hypothetical protein
MDYGHSAGIGEQEKGHEVDPKNPLESLLVPMFDSYNYF